MSLSDYKFALAVVSIVFVAGSVRTWDLGVVTSAQIQFFKNKEIETLAADRLKDMTAIAYDPIKKDVYVSDANQKVGSIFRMKTTGDAAYTAVEPIVAKQSATVQGMAFDYRTSILYWTTGNGLSINYVHVPENVTKVPLTGVVLFKFKDVIPQGIAIDTCRGYLYWTNCNHLNATIERSRPDGSEHTVLIHEQLFQPLGIAVDMENDLLYWSNEREGMYYSIEASNLDGGTRRTLIHGTHHQPFSIALDERDIYWSDWVNDVVWTMPKDSFQGGVQPTAVVKYESIKTPMGLITSTPAIVNDTQCIAVTRTQNNTWLMTEATLQETVSYEALRNYCKNNGILHANGTCTCALGFEGNFCTTHVCQDYCVSGTCTVDSMGRPQCHCPADFTGERCELQMCTDRCQNGGQCLLDKDGHNRCDCPIGYTGNMCENKLSDFINELCSVYCQPSNPLMKTASAVCSCEEYISGHHYDYSNMEISSCKLSKTIIAIMGFLFVMVACFGTTTLVLARKVRFLGRRPRIKKRIVVNKSITPLQSCRPPQQQNQQCEITIENCCNMNICETPCFEPDYRPPKLGGLLNSLGKSKKEDKANLLSNTDMSSEDEKPSF